MNCKYSQKYAPQAENFFNVSLRINSFCVPFQVTIGETKTFMGRRKNLMRGKDPHNGKTCLLEEVLSTIPKTPSCNYNHFMTPFPLIKRSLHPQNGHYQNCVDRSLVENLTAPASVKMNSTATLSQ